MFGDNCVTWVVGWVTLFFEKSALYQGVLREFKEIGIYRLYKVLHGDSKGVSEVFQVVLVNFTGFREATCRPGYVDFRAILGGSMGFPEFYEKLLWISGGFKGVPGGFRGRLENLNGLSDQSGTWGFKKSIGASGVFKKDFKAFLELSGTLELSTRRFQRNF